MTKAMEAGLLCLLEQTGDGSHVSPGYFGAVLYGGTGRRRTSFARPGSNMLSRLEAAGFAVRDRVGWGSNRYRITDEGKAAAAALREGHADA